MAYDDSEALQPNSAYSLGGYTFELEVQSVHEPGEPDAVSVFAICRGPDGTRETVAKDFPSGTNVVGWYVEANETEASVYATIAEDVGSHTSELDTGPYTQPIPSASGARHAYTQNNAPIRQINEWAVLEAGVLLYMTPTSVGFLLASKTQNAVVLERTRTIIDLRTGETTSETSNTGTARSITIDGKTAYYNIYTVGGLGTKDLELSPGLTNYAIAGEPYDGRAAWTILYGTPQYDDTKDVLIGRFAIDLSEADGGPDGDWDEPGSDGPFSDQIYVEVTGASAGTHSASNIPQEAPEQFTYGSGGIGGNGGGGGAGASTVIIYDFVSHKTSIDGPAENAIIREPGSGGPGGKGGKGGDGCILIFY